MKLTYITLAIGILMATPLPQEDRLEELKADLLEDFMEEAGLETRGEKKDVFEDRKFEEVFVEEENPVDDHIDELIEKIEEIQGEDEKVELIEVEEITDSGDNLVLIDDLVIDENDQAIIDDEIELIDEAPTMDEGLTSEDYEGLDEYFSDLYPESHASRKGGRGHGRGHGHRGRRPRN